MACRECFDILKVCKFLVIVRHHIPGHKCQNFVPRHASSPTAAAPVLASWFLPLFSIELHTFSTAA